MWSTSPHILNRQKTEVKGQFHVPAVLLTEEDPVVYNGGKNCSCRETKADPPSRS